jgi:hypothetical protein
MHLLTGVDLLQLPLCKNGDGLGIPVNGSRKGRRMLPIGGKIGAAIIQSGLRRRHACLNGCQSVPTRGASPAGRGTGTGTADYILQPGKSLLVRTIRRTSDIGRRM